VVPTRSVSNIVGVWDVMVVVHGALAKGSRIRLRAFRVHPSGTCERGRRSTICGLEVRLRVCSRLAWQL
jgi:hypothetical protein